MTVVSKTLERTEGLSQLDAPADALQRGLRGALPDKLPGIAPLSGSWLGHPLHPVLVLAPIGSWLATSVLDALPGQEVAARRMVLTGLLSAGPAVLTGAVDFRELSGPRRRVGFLHLLANATGTLCYAASYLARRRGHHGIGRALALAGLAAVGTAGTLGGHLTYAQGVGVYRWQPERSGQRPSEPASRPTTVAGF